MLVRQVFRQDSHLLYQTLTVPLYTHLHVGHPGLSFSVAVGQVRLWRRWPRPSRAESAARCGRPFSELCTRQMRGGPLAPCTPDSGSGDYPVIIGDRVVLTFSTNL